MCGRLSKIMAQDQPDLSFTPTAVSRGMVMPTQTREVQTEAHHRVSQSGEKEVHQVWKPEPDEPGDGAQCTQWHTHRGASSFGSIAGSVAGMKRPWVHPEADKKCWNLSYQAGLQELVELQQKERPEILIRSPSPPSAEDGGRHVDIAVRGRQLEMEKHYVHKHPCGGFSWNADSMKALAAESRVHLVTWLPVPVEAERSDICLEDWHAMKSGAWQQCGRRHLVPQHATIASIFPLKTVVAVWKALRKQMVLDAPTNRVDMSVAGPVPGEGDVHEQLNGAVCVDNRWITPELLRARREEEMGYMKKHGVHVVVHAAPRRGVHAQVGGQGYE